MSIISNSLLSTPIPSNDDKMESKISLMIHQKPRNNWKATIYPQIKNWETNFQIPWFAILEFFIMALYLIFGSIHQNEQCQSSISLTKIINDYFMSDYDFPEADEDTNRRIGIIYQPSKLFDIVNSTGYRFTTFFNDVITYFPVDAVGPISLFVTTLSGLQKTYYFTHKNISQISEISTFLVKRFKTFDISRNFSTLYHYGTFDRKFNLIIHTLFEKDPNSNIVRVKTSHAHYPEDKSSSHRLMYDHLVYIPIVLSILSFIVIILNISYTFQMWKFAKQKSSLTFEEPSIIFWRKFDKWFIYSFLSHFSTIISCTFYALTQDTYTNVLPQSYICLAISTFIHTTLMIRYLSLKPSSLLIVNVLFHGGLNMIQFLIGCLVFLYAYLVFGCSIFGTFTVNFTRFFQGAVVLIAVIHGDSIQDMYDGVIDHSDVSWTWGFFYMTIWIFFSLTVMFNISISIFEQALKKEIFKAVDITDVEVNQFQTLDSLTFALPITYSNVF